MKNDYYEVFSEYDNFADLEAFLDQDFLPHVVMTKQKKNSNGVIDYYPYIPLRELSKLKLSEEETKHALEYLYKTGIRVIGKDNSILTDFEDYNVMESYQESLLPERFLTNEEQEEKFALLNVTHDSVLREQLIVNNLRIVPFIIWRYFKDITFDKKDLEQFGYEGLIKAVDHYVAGTGKTFFGYAQKAIYNYIIKTLRTLGDYKKYLTDIGLDIRNTELELGVNIHENPEFIKYVGEQGKVRMKLEKKLNRNATDQEVANAMNKSIDFVKEYLNRVTFLIKESINEKEEDTSEELYYEDEFEKVDTAPLKETILELLSTLSETESEVIKLRFGLNENEERLTLEQVAKRLGGTKERIRLIESTALRKLRHPIRAKKIKDYYEYVPGQTSLAPKHKK